MENQLAVIEPGQTQLELPMPDGVRFTKRGLFMPENIGLEDWQRIGQFLRNSDSALAFWWADYIAHGRKLFGNDTVAEILNQLEFEQSDFKKSQLLATLPVRDPDLSTEHHYILARAKLDEVGRNMWVDLAKQNKLSAPELQESIKKGTVTRIERDASGGSGAGGVSTWGGLILQFNLMRQQVGDAPLVSWPVDQVEKLLATLAPITKFVSDLQFRRRELLKPAGNPNGNQG